MIRTKALPALVVVLALVAFFAIVTLQSESNDGRDAELKLAGLKTALSELQLAPFQAAPMAGGSPKRALTVIRADKRKIAAALRGLREGSSAPSLNMIEVPLRANYAALGKIYAIVREVGVAPADERPGNAAAHSHWRLNLILAAASSEYKDRASTAESTATAGSAATIAVLILAFLFLYRRANRARDRAEQLAEQNGALASTDALTQLGNRRALVDDLAEEISAGDQERELIVVLFDLDGFKQYNDSFGHPAGDSLLARLGTRLLESVADSGKAYRMGGDEFCVLARAAPDRVDALVSRAADALTETGEGFEIQCSLGVARLPGEATSAEKALQLADRRMYADKAGRSSASRQSADVLLEVINERSPELRDHIKQVAMRAVATAEKLGVPEHQVAQIGIAAELHDIGKAAIPDSILKKPGPLDEDERQFIRTHTVIGERIMLAAPSLAPLAGMVRSSHERYDGAGYPDGLRASEIPSGAAIIAVCDAFDAMVGSRPYRDSIADKDALEELARSSGSQFDPEVVEAFLAVVAEERELSPA